MSRTAVIMQPTYLPWVGYFDLLDQADIAVLFDDAQFSRKSWHQRNRIRTPTGLQWLTVPVRKTGNLGASIRDAEIVDPERNLEKHLRGIELNYRQAPYFDEYYEGLRGVLLADHTDLGTLNVDVIQWLGGVLGIEVVWKLSSKVGGQGRRTELMEDICRRIGSDRYLAPRGSAEYICDEYTEERGRLEVVFHSYEHPAYRQCHAPPFLPYASVIDLLFNEGEASLDVVRSGRREPVPISLARRNPTILEEGIEK